MVLRTFHQVQVQVQVQVQGGVLPPKRHTCSEEYYTSLTLLLEVSIGIHHRLLLQFFLTSQLLAAWSILDFSLPPHEPINDDQSSGDNSRNSPLYPLILLFVV